MSVQPEFYDNYPANLPLLSLQDLRALHDYNEELIKTEAEADLRFMTQQSVPSFSEVPSDTTASEKQDAGAQWNSWNDRDNEITRALCEDQQDKKARWKILYEQWSMARRATDMKLGAEEGQSGEIPYLDPCLQNAGTTAIQHHNNQIRAMSALLHLQDQEAQSQRQSLTENSPNESLHVQHISKVRPSIDQNSLPPEDATATNLSHTVQPTDEPATLVPGPLHPTDAPMQYPQTDVLPDGALQDHGAFRINLPSVSFLPQPTDGYSHPAIHFPSLTYIIDTPANNSNCKHHDSTPEHNQAQSQHTTNALAPYTSFSSPVVAPSTISDLAVPPSLSLLTEQTTSQPLKKVKKGTEPKKTYVPTRRWSRTHLNKLMREHRPRNLPESIKLTDHIDVQDISIRKLTPTYCVAGAENNGQVVQFGAGTRVEVQYEASGDSSIPVLGGILNRIETRRLRKITPFRLVIRDQQGNVKVDMRWESDVAIDDPVDVNVVS